MPPFEYQPFVNPYAPSIGELLAHQNDAQAHAAESIAASNARATEIRGNAWGRAAEAIGQIPQQVQAAKDAEQQRVLKGQEIAARTMDLQDRAQQHQTATQQRIVTTIGTLAKGAESPDEFGARVDDMVSLGGLPKDVGAHIKANLAAGDWPSIQKKYVDFAAQYAKPEKLGQGEQIINPVSGSVIATGTPKPPTTAELALLAGQGDPAAGAAMDRLHPKPQPTEAGLAAMAAGGDDTAQSALDALQAPIKAQRDETARHNLELEKIAKLTAGREAARNAETARHDLAMEAVNEQVPSLTPDALHLVSKQFAMTGQLPPMGMGKAGAKVRTDIINDAAEQYKGLDLASQKAAYEANKSTLTKLTQQRAAIGAFEETAKKNVDLFLEQAGKVVDTGSPYLNTPIRMITGKLLGSADQAAFDAARQVAVNEIAKITSNPTLAGTLSDSARHEVEAFNPQNATLQQSVAVMRLLRKDMDNRTSSLDNQIQGIQRVIATPPGGSTSSNQPIKVGGFTVVVK